MSLLAQQKKEMMEPKNQRFLIVDDESTSVLILKTILKNMGMRVDLASSPEEMYTKLAQVSFDGVFLDYRLGDQNGLNLLPKILRMYPFTRVIMITAHGSIDLAISAMQKGFSGFITKPFEEEKVLEELTKLFIREEKEAQTNDRCTDLKIIGNSPEMTRVIQQIYRMNDVDSNVLILGESGTGKELVARALHETSIRKSARFEAINCAAIPETLLEAELFGVKKGAFTDAKESRKGLFEICCGGTLFLDEIGDMPIHLQSKILRALQEKEITPLGSSQTIKVTTKVVAATNQRLPKLVEEGTFRKDLFYRLSVLQITLPPLKDRRGDVMLLAQHFVASLCSQMNREMVHFDRAFEMRLQSYDWPGNVRELYNSLERAIVLAENNQLKIEDVFAHLDHATFEEANKEPSAKIRPLTEERDEFEKQYLIRLMEHTNGNVSQASEIAGRIRTDMYRLLNKHDIDLASFKAP